MLAARYKPTAVAPLLAFLTQHFDGLGINTVKEILTKTTRNGLNALMLAVVNQPTAIAPLLAFLTQHFEALGDTAKEILTKTTADGWNALMLAAANQPTAIAPLLAFLTQHLDGLGINTAKEILTKTNNDGWNGWNALMLAAEYQNTAPSLLKFIMTYADQLNLPKMKFPAYQKGVINAHIKPLLLERCEQEAYSGPNFSKGFVALASSTIGRDQFCEIFIEASKTVSFEKRARFLKYGLDKNNPVGKFLSAHHWGTKFFSTSNTKSQNLLSAELAILHQPLRLR
jgi:hypothetical protein